MSSLNIEIRVRLEVHKVGVRVTDPDIPIYELNIRNMNRDGNVRGMRDAPLQVYR